MAWEQDVTGFDPHWSAGLQNIYQDPNLDALWDQLKAAPTPEEFSRLSHEVQRHVLRNMIQISATTLPFIQAARDYVKGYVYERGFKIRFETTWLDKP